MASISLGSFYGYANGNTSYGYYNVTFNYDSVSRSGTTITVTNAYVQMKNPNSGYTTNTVYVDSVTINGTNVGISGSANGGTSYHTWSTSKKNVTFTADAGTTSVTVKAGCHRTGQSSGAQSCSGTLTIPIGSVTVSFDANGGTGAPAAQTKTGGVALTISSTKPTRATANTVDGYKVYLDANGGTCSTTSMTATIKRSWTFSTWSDSKYSSVDYIRILKYYGTRDFYLTQAEIDLYDANKDGKLDAVDKQAMQDSVMNAVGISVAAGGSLTTELSSNTTLYAMYTSTDTTNPITLPTPTRPGYSFKGWATSRTATSGTTGSYTPTETGITLYAIWKKENFLISNKSSGSFAGGGVLKVKNSSGAWVEVYGLYIKNSNGTYVQY